MLKISFNTGDKDPISRRALNIKHWHLMCVLYKRKRLHNTSSTKPTTTIRSTQAGNSQYHGILNFSNYPCTQRHSIRNSPFSAPRKFWKIFDSHFSSNHSYYLLFITQISFVVLPKNSIICFLILNTTLIRPVVSYAAEAWTLTKKEEQTLLIFERKIFRRMYDPKY